MRTHRVLVTGMGGPAGIAFLHAAGRPDLEFVAVDMDACAAGLYLVPAGRRALVPPGDADDFVDALLHLCIAADVNVLVPTVDAELLPIARRRREFHDAGIALLMASEVTLGICLDKWQLAQTCAGRVDLPDTALLDRYFEPDAWTWPAIAKPRRGSGSRGVITVRDAEAARLLPSDGTLIVQELLPGLEYSLDVLAYPDGHVAAVVPRSRLRVDSGIAIAGSTSRDAPLERLGREVARIVGLTTVANVQVKADVDGTPKLLEVNPRFPGSMPLTVASGVNMPALAMASLLGEPVPPSVDSTPTAMVRTWNEQFLSIEEFGAVGYDLPAPAAAAPA